MSMNNGDWLSRKLLLTAVLFSASCGFGLSAIGQSELSGPREFLQLLGVDDSKLANLIDGEPIGSADEETLAQILYCLPRILPSDLRQWSQPLADSTTLLASPDDHRLEAFLVRGRAQRVERIELNSHVAELFDLDHYFRVVVELDRGGQVLVCAREVPSAWLGLTEIDEPVSAYALFLKSGSSQGTPQPVLAAPRVGWHPDTPHPEQGITADQVYVASLGLDVGLLGEMRQLNRKAITHADRECFYQMLAAIGQADRNEFAGRVDPSLDLAALLQTPERQHGRLFTVKGTARRVLRVRVEDEDIRRRFGIDHYYQIDVFVPLRDQAIRLGEEADSPTFTNSYPVTVCVPKLPTDLAEGPDIREEVVVPAASFKLWAYRSQFVTGRDKRERQISPMLIGVEPRVVRSAIAVDHRTSLVVASCFLGALALAWLFIWRTSRNDPRLQRSFFDPDRRIEP